MTVLGASAGWTIGLVLGVVVVLVAAAIVITIVALAQRIAGQARGAVQGVEIVRSQTDALEGIARINAWSRIERGVGGPGTHYIRADDYQERLQEMTLKPEKLLIVGDLGGERNVASICEASKLDDFEVCRTLWAFRVIGILRRLDAPPTQDAG